MPNLDGIGACRLIRQESDLPILMLTARDEVSDRIRGLEAGADDYLGKPFAVVELLARLRALLRRTAGALGSLRYADLELDIGEQRAAAGRVQFSLTRMELALLEFFLQTRDGPSTGRRSSGRSGATTPSFRRTHSTCSSARCAARPRRTASRG